MSKPKIYNVITSYKEAKCYTVSYIMAKLEMIWYDVTEPVIVPRPPDIEKYQSEY